jgi:predicted nicotinamide N-methyase
MRSSTTGGDACRFGPPRQHPNIAAGRVKNEITVYGIEPMTGSEPTSPQLHRRRQRLLGRIHRNYVTSTKGVRVGEFAFSFTRIADPDRVLDQVAAQADLRERLAGSRQPDEHLHLPYWAELWDSAMGIGQFLVRSWGEGEDGETPGHGEGETRGRGDAGTRGWRGGEKKMLTGGTKDRRADRLGFSARVPASRRLRVPASRLSVLDLGCGLGLSGTVATALGARVLFADLEPPALLFAQLNSLPWSSRVRTRKLNWQTDRLGEQFDLIIGADILYERAQWDYQEPFLRHHLARGGSVLLGEPGRQTGDSFIEWIGQREWRLQVFSEVLSTREKPVRILHLVPADRAG